MAMIKIKIAQEHGKGRNVVHLCVYEINQLTGDWIFLKAFFTEERAKKYAEKVKRQLWKGDYSSLTLKGDKK